MPARSRSHCRSGCPHWCRCRPRSPCASSTPPGGTAALPETGESVQTDAGAARRRIVDAAPVDADADEVVLLRTIDYTWLHDGRYLLAFASISGLPGPDYRPITDAMTLLVTTMLDALTWPTADGEVSS